eukprot:5659226-Pyramimonas_sp.AAC.1
MCMVRVGRSNTTYVVGTVSPWLVLTTNSPNAGVSEMWSYAMDPSGSADSLLGVSIINLITKKRHLLGFLRTSEYCECGCGGHCSVHAMFHVAAWMLEALVNGTVPPCRHDGSPWDPFDELNIPGESLGGFRCMILHLKGDWAEYQKSFGLSSWAHAYNPCPICDCPKDCMHITGPGFITSDGMLYPDRDEDEYERACERCEIRINVNSEKLRSAILGCLTYEISGRSAKGRVLMSSIPGFPELGLERLDRLDPSPSMINPNLFEQYDLPFEAVFWRTHYDISGKKKTDWVIHRSQIFSRALGTNPVRTLAIDSLHTVYLGNMMMVVSCAFMRVLHANPWKTNAPNRLRRLVHDLESWYDYADVPADMRLGTITDKILPSDRPDPHPGGMMRVKAAECHVLLNFSIYMLQKHLHMVQKGVHLLRAGLALEEWCNTCRSARTQLTIPEYQKLLDTCAVHIFEGDKAGIHQLPKHHSFGHLTIRSPGR